MRRLFLLCALLALAGCAAPPPAEPARERAPKPAKPAPKAAPKASARPRPKPAALRRWKRAIEARHSLAAAGVFELRFRMRNRSDFVEQYMSHERESVRVLGHAMHRMVYEVRWTVEGADVRLSEESFVLLASLDDEGQRIVKRHLSAYQGVFAAFSPAYAGTSKEAPEELKKLPANKLGFRVHKAKVTERYNRASLLQERVVRAEGAYLWSRFQYLRPQSPGSAPKAINWQFRERAKGPVGSLELELDYRREGGLLVPTKIRLQGQREGANRLAAIEETSEGLRHTLVCEGHTLIPL